MEAFEEVVKDHSPKIYYFLRRMGLAHEAADEIVQDVFILFWRDLKNGHGLEGVHFRLYQHAAKKLLSSLNKTANIPLQVSAIKDKLVFVLKQQEDFDFDDISEMLNWTISDVRNSFKSALKI